MDNMIGEENIWELVWWLRRLEEYFFDNVWEAGLSSIALLLNMLALIFKNWIRRKIREWWRSLRGPGGPGGLGGPDGPDDPAGPEEPPAQGGQEDQS